MEPHCGKICGGHSTMTRPLKLLLLTSHPVQYASPIFRLLAKDPRVEVEVAYCSMQGADAHVDPDFGVEVKWDIPLLDGYRWTELRNRSWRPGPGSFFGLINPRIWTLIREGNFDAVVAYTGYAYATFWIALTAAKLSGTPILFGTDATSLNPRDGRSWKLHVKKRLLPWIFRRANGVIVPSEAGRQFISGLGIPLSRIFLTPFVVDNEWWLRRASEVDRSAVRCGWQVSEDTVVLLFCAKLQPWKRPHDVLLAFANCKVPNACLIFVGDGPLRSSLEIEASRLAVGQRVRFLGFINQTALPSVYRAADLFVIPSAYDPCPAVVCEAMLCGCPVVLSDQIQGRFDLVQTGETGFVYPCGDIDALTKIFSALTVDSVGLAKLGCAAVARMQTWSPRENVEALLHAIEKSRFSEGSEEAPISARQRLGT